MRPLSTVALFAAIAVSLALSGCTSTSSGIGSKAASPSSATDKPVAAPTAKPNAAPFAGLPGPAPVYDPSYDPTKIWLADGSTYYTATQIEQCKSLGLQDYLVRLSQDPVIGQAQMSSLKVHCSWSQAEADVDGPISYPASQAWDYLVGRAPDNFTDLGSVQIGADSDVIEIPLVGGGNRYFGTAKTSSAVYYMSIFDSPGAKVTSAFYTGAIRQMLGQMVSAGAAMGPNLTPLTAKASTTSPTCDEAKLIFGHFNPGADAAWTEFSQEHFHGDETAADGWASDQCGLSYE